MSSFKMHIAISEKIKEKFSFGDEFILGTVLPDLYKILLKNKELTHFERKFGEEYLPDIEKFCGEYKDSKSEIVYGYLAHLVEDKVWFGKYNNKKYVKKSENGEFYKYLKDDTIHTSKEYEEDIYTDYAIIDKYIVEKNELDGKEINEKLKKCVLSNKNIKEKEELIKLIDTKIIDYSKQYDTSKEITFFETEDADEYYDIALKEVENVLKQFIEK